MFSILLVSVTTVIVIWSSGCAPFTYTSPHISLCETCAGVLLGFTADQPRKGKKLLPSKREMATSATSCLRFNLQLNFRDMIDYLQEKSRVIARSTGMSLINVLRFNPQRRFFE